MKSKILLTAAMCLATVVCTQANIIGNTLADDGDGVMVCNTYGFIQTGPQDFQLEIDGAHYAPLGYIDIGHIVGNIYTDTETDPSLTLLQSIDNDTGLTWEDYDVQITMNKTFTFSNVTVDHGWLATVTQPTLQGSDWIGDIHYYVNGGTLVPNLDTLDFGFKLTFVGSVAYCQADTPSIVPEPGSISLVGLGVAGVVIARRRFAR